MYGGAQGLHFVPCTSSTNPTHPRQGLQVAAGSWCWQQRKLLSPWTSAAATPSASALAGAAGQPKTICCGTQQQHMAAAGA